MSPPAEFTTGIEISFVRCLGMDDPERKGEKTASRQRIIPNKYNLFKAGNIKLAGRRTRRIDPCK